MTETAGTRDPKIRALRQELAQASNPQVTRIVATVDAMTSRGVADDLIAPLRHRLIQLRPPRQLRFARLLFHPLNPLIVSATRWRLGQLTIPRTALAPIAEQVHLIMGEAGRAIDAAIAGHTDAETDLIAELGRMLWPEAERILAEPAIPGSWDTTELGNPTYHALADIVSTLLGQSVALNAVCTATANGLLPPRAEAIGQILGDVAAKNAKALPMMITLLLTCLPRAAACLAAFPGAAGAAIHAAANQAADLMLRQLDEADGVEIRIATGSHAESGGTVADIAALLQSLETEKLGSARREQLRAIRERLDAGCKSRFASGLQDDLLIPLGRMAAFPDTVTISMFEKAARGLRVLETEGRKVGKGASYDLLLEQAAATLKAGAVRDLLSTAEKARLVEILAGSDAALGMLDARS